jgi:hypothetical protein
VTMTLRIISSLRLLAALAALLNTKLSQPRLALGF